MYRPTRAPQLVVLIIVALFAWHAPVQALPAFAHAYAQLGDPSPYSCNNLWRSSQDDGRAHLGNASASVNGTAPLNCEGEYAHGNVPWDGYAVAEADLFSATLHAVAYASGPIGTASSAMFQDSIRLHGAGAGQVRIGLDLDGLLDSSLTSLLSYHLCLGVTRGETPTARGTECQTFSNAGPSGSYGIPTHEDVHRLMTIWVPATIDEPINIFASLTVSSSGDAQGGRAVVDLGHTARLLIDLPEGMNFSSESGALLTSAVPEPGTAWLGVGGLGVMLTRRRVTRPRGRQNVAVGSSMPN